MATIERIQPIADKIKDSFSLCELMANHGSRASEKELMIAQTIKACVINHEKHGQCFSYRGDGVFTSAGNGIVDNRTAYGYLVSSGYFSEANRDGRVIIEPTDKLLDLLESYFAKQ